jgi:hypothetical protein
LRQASSLYDSRFLFSSFQDWTCSKAEVSKQLYALKQALYIMGRFGEAPLNHPAAGPAGLYGPRLPFDFLPKTFYT